MDEADAADNLTHATLLILGDNQADWLRGHLQKSIESIKNYVHADTTAPTRETMIETAKSILQHANALNEKLSEATLSRLQKVTSPDPDLLKLPALLADLTYRLNVEIDVIKRQQKKGDASRGIPVHQHESAKIVEGDVLAAAACIAAWTAVRGKAPAQSNSTAHDAAEAIWHAAGGKGPKKWSPIFQKASCHPFSLDGLLPSPQTSRLLWT